MKNTNIRKLSVLQFTYLMAASAYGSFYVVILKEADFPIFSISMVVSLWMITSIIFQPVWGLVCDKVRSVRKVFMLLTGGFIIVMGITFLFGENFSHLVLAFMILLANCFFCGMTPLLDTWVIQCVKVSPGKATFGTIRVWGSTGFMIIAPVLGYFSEKYSASIAFGVAAVVSLVSVFTASRISHDGMPPENNEQVNGFSFKDVRLLLKDYYYLALLITMFFIFLPGSFENMYFILRVEAIGEGNSLYGLCLMFFTLFEIPFYYFSGKIIDKIGTVKTLAFSLAVLIIQFFFFSFNFPIIAMFFGCLLRGIGFGLLFSSLYVYIDILAPGNLKTTAMSLLTMVYSPLAGLVSSILFGLYSEMFTIFQVFLIGGFIGLAGLIIFIVTYVLGKKHLGNVPGNRHLT